MQRLPPFISGCCLGLYWTTVAAKAYRARRWQHGANVIPPERTGRWLRLLWLPLVIIWCVQPWIAATSGGRNFQREGYVTAWVGAGLCVFATAATFFCWRAMGRSWRIGIDPMEKTDLVRSGPFRFVRHPIYSLSILLMIGTLATTQTRLMAITAAVHFVLLQFEAAREEAYLLQKHGDDYALYRQTTGRFIPRLRLAK